MSSFILPKTYAGDSCQAGPLGSAQFAQAMQWVRCYQHQSCDDPNWKTTFAYHYTQRLRIELESKVIGCFATSGVYDGPGLT